jgi:hypothetical protein
MTIIDATTSRLHSPLGDSRERAVGCRICFKQMTWNWWAACDSCLDKADAERAFDLDCGILRQIAARMEWAKPAMAV